MNNYGDNLRRERRSELAMRTFSPEMINEYGEVTFATKTEAGASFPAAAYAYVPDAKTPSTWKLRLWATPTGGPDAGIVGAAVAALGKGFRGNKVQIPAADLPAVKAKVKAAWIKANQDKDPKKDLPTILASGIPASLEVAAVETEASEVDALLLACGGTEHTLELSVNVDGISATPSPGVVVAVRTLTTAAQLGYSGYGVTCDIDIDVDNNGVDSDDSDVPELDVSIDGISQTPFDGVKAAFDDLVSVIKATYGNKVDIDVDIDVATVDIIDTADENMIAPYGEGYSTDGVEELSIETDDTSTEGTEELGNEGVIEELGTLPPALKAALVKKLTAQLAKETDPKKKAAIQAKIKLYS